MRVTIPHWIPLEVSLMFLDPFPGRNLGQTTERREQNSEHSELFRNELLHHHS